MTNIILEYPKITEDDDLVYTDLIAYQKNPQPFDYDESYFENYVNRAGTEVANKLNKARVAMCYEHIPPWCAIVDVGIGSGEFIERCKDRQVYGYDINEVGINWLKERNLYIDIYDKIPNSVSAFTLWDTLEHIPNPNEFLNVMKPCDILLTSLPIFENLSEIKESKHYKPNEHLYYFTIDGLIAFMEDSGFSYIEHNNMETKAGREGITSFVFVKR